MPLLHRSLAISVLVAVPAVVAAQPLTFVKSDYVSAPGARAVVVADFNRDGWPDVAHAGLGSNTLALLLNTQGRGFAPAIGVPVGSGPFDLTSADFNRDGIPDLAVANADSNTLSILLGRGNGRFDRRDIATSASPRGITTGDFDKDGKLDLACTTYSGAAVHVFFGDGAGGFDLRWSLDGAAQPQGIVNADFTRDGHPDFAVAYDAPEGLIVWRGPAGSYLPSVVPGESFLNVVATADLNGDGWMDVAAASTSRGRVAVYLSRPSGLAFARSYVVDGDPRGITTADVNADGVLDVITANRATSTVTVLPGDPAHRGSFLPRLTFPAGVNSRAIAVADFDGDGLPDLVTGNQYASNISVLANTTAMLPAGYSFARLTMPAGTTLARVGGLAAADFNSDGKLDLLQEVANSSSAAAVVLSSGRTVVLTAVGPDADHIAGDFNGDGNVDVAHVSLGGMQTSLGDGRGHFTPSVITKIWPGSACTAGDMDRNGRLDLVCSNGVVMSGNGDGTFVSGPEFPINERPLVIDVNNDGVLDVVVASGTVCLGNGAGGPSSCAYAENGALREGVAAADLNHDGYLDLVFSDGRTDVAVFLGSAEGYVRGAAWSGSLGAGEFTTIAIADLNADGRADILVNALEVKAGATGILRVLPGRGDGSFGPAQAFALAPGDILAADVTRDGLPDVVAASGAELDVLVNQRSATNHPPVVTAPDLTVDRLGCLTFPIEVSDPDEHALSIDWQGDVLPRGLVGRLESATACVDAPGVYRYRLSASDGRGAVSARAFTITVVGPQEIVLDMTSATAFGNGAWSIVSDPATAGGVRAYNRNAGAPKVNAPLAQPVSHVELSFLADPTAAYKLWLRLEADGNHWSNDSVWVQFSGSTDLAGTPMYRIGTTSGLAVNLEECSACGEQGWGWEDDGWGALNRNGVLLRFPEGGRQRIRIQTREDGVSVDQIVLSAATYRTARPGTARNDTTILNPTTRGPSFDVLVNFRCQTIGCAPNGPFFQASDGWFYGTTSEGGPGPHEGTLFRLNREGSFQLLPVPAANGEFLSLAIFEASDGLFYGSGGEDPGRIFRMDRTGAVTVLHEFAAGAVAVALAQARDGWFYGISAGDGATGAGTVFRMDSAGVVTVLRSLDVSLSPTAFFQARDGLFYGTTYYGTVFRLTLSGAVTVLHSFDSVYVGLMQASDSLFYGTTSEGGATGGGTLFRMDATGRVTVLHSFDGSTGRAPLVGPIEARDGFLYGLTTGGGAYGLGVVYRMNRAGAVAILHSFNGSDGSTPAAAVIEGDDGALYGATASGGTYRQGVVFRIAATVQ